jgi:cytochrome c oxidase cbb3-type subunit 3
LIRYSDAIIFKGNCFACHGKLGEGGVGPNLTDDFWIHGGSIKDIFKTIKYGYPDKGMKSWQADLSSLQINELASYIKTLYGSRPANGKSAQGDMYVELTNQKDSLKTEGFPVPQPIIESPKAGH